MGIPQADNLTFNPYCKSYQSSLICTVAYACAGISVDAGLQRICVGEGELIHGNQLIELIDSDFLAEIKYFSFSSFDTPIEIAKIRSRPLTMPQSEPIPVPASLEALKRFKASARLLDLSKPREKETDSTVPLPLAPIVKKTSKELLKRLSDLSEPLPKNKYEPPAKAKPIVFAKVNEDIVMRLCKWSQPKQPRPQRWQLPHMVKPESKIIALLNFRHRSLTGMPDGRCVWNDGPIGDWEKWTVIDNDNAIFLRSAHGLYITTTVEGNISANKSTTDVEESFLMYETTDGHYLLQSLLHQHYISSAPGGVTKVTRDPRDERASLTVLRQDERCVICEKIIQGKLWGKRWGYVYGPAIASPNMRKFGICRQCWGNDFPCGIRAALNERNLTATADPPSYEILLQRVKLLKPHIVPSMDWESPPTVEDIRLPTNVVIQDCFGRFLTASTRDGLSFTRDNITHGMVWEMIASPTPTSKAKPYASIAIRSTNNGNDCFITVLPDGRFRAVKKQAKEWETFLILRMGEGSVSLWSPAHNFLLGILEDGSLMGSTSPQNTTTHFKIFPPNEDQCTERSLRTAAVVFQDEGKNLFNY